MGSWNGRRVRRGVDDKGSAVRSCAAEWTFFVRGGVQPFGQVVDELFAFGHAVEGDVPRWITTFEACFTMLYTAGCIDRIEPGEKVVNPTSSGARDVGYVGALGLLFEDVGQRIRFARGEAAADGTLL